MKHANRSENGAVPIVLLLPHAPVLVPAVAGRRLADCGATVAAMTEAARRLVVAAADAVVLVSPHAPRVAAAFGVTEGGVEGTLARFGAAQAAVRLPGDTALSDELRDEARQRGLPTARLGGGDLDHGSVVPLWYLCEAGWRGPTVIVALAGADNACIDELGACVAVVAARLGRRVAVVSSGDMSHRLQPGAPCGYDPRAAVFDRAFMAQLRGGATCELAAAVAPWRERAAEDAVEATLFGLGAAGWRNDGREVLGYEGPFGVGYGVAVLFAEPASVGERDPRCELPALARAAIVAALGRTATLAEPVAGRCPGAGGVFVTVYTADGRLRGCMGTLGASSGDLAVETWRMARAAALHDPRFPPVRAAELAGLRLEVTVLGPLEEIESEAELDPRRWGVVVRAEDGRRGLLLPDIPSVASVVEQVAIARRKAGVGDAERVRLQRFSARRFEEERTP